MNFCIEISSTDISKFMNFLQDDLNNQDHHDISLFTITLGFLKNGTHMIHRPYSGLSVMIL